MIYNVSAATGWLLTSGKKQFGCSWRYRYHYAVTPIRMSISRAARNLHVRLNKDALTSYQTTHFVNTTDEPTLVEINGACTVDDSAQGLRHTRHLLSDNAWKAVHIQSGDWEACIAGGQGLAKMSGWKTLEKVTLHHRSFRPTRRTGI